MLIKSRILHAHSVMLKSRVKFELDLAHRTVQFPRGNERIQRNKHIPIQKTIEGFNTEETSLVADLEKNRD